LQSGGPAWENYSVGSLPAENMKELKDKKTEL
jgi:hypothetical protein